MVGGGSGWLYLPSDDQSGLLAKRHAAVDTQNAFIPAWSTESVLCVSVSM